MKTNFLLKNFTFVLFFDRAIVASALDQSTGNKGSDYIRKIIQAEFDLPEIDSQKIKKEILNLIIKYTKKNHSGQEIDPHIRTRYDELFDHHLKFYIKTFRDVKRFISSFQFSFKMQYQEIENYSREDFVRTILKHIGEEVLRLFENEIFQETRNSPRFLLLLDIKALTNAEPAYQVPAKRKEYAQEVLRELLLKGSKNSNPKDLEKFLIKLYSQLEDPG